MANTTFQGPVISKNGFYDNRKCYLTYEEVTDGSRQHGVVR